MVRLARLHALIICIMLVIVASAGLVSASAPEIIGDVKIEMTEHLNWVVTFTTDMPGLSSIEYGLDQNYGNETDEFIGLTAKHELMLHGLAAGQTYHFRIITKDWMDNTHYSDNQTFETPAVRAPRHITAHGVGDRAVIGWEPIFAPEEYVVYRSEVSGESYDIVGRTNDHTFTDQGLVEGLSYFYVVAAVDADGVAHRSAEVEVTPHPLTDHVLAAWLFTEGEGEIVRDSSINQVHGEFVQADWVEGRFNYAARINPGENWIKVPDANPVTPAGTELTISVWFYLEKLPDTNEQYPNSRILQAGSYNPDSSGKGMSDSGVRLLFEWGDFVWAPHPNERLTRDQHDAMVAGEWQHLAAVYAGDAMRLYVNGKLYAEESASGSVIGSNIDRAKNTLFIGTKHPGGSKGNWWDGRLDEIAIFDKALTEDEVNLVMNGLSVLF